MANDQKVFALVLAAGTSRRLGRPKQLLELDGRTLVALVTEAALGAEVDGVVVVIGAHASKTRSELRDYPVYSVFNPHYEAGQGTSLAAGIRAMPSTVDAVVILLVDMPQVRSSAISAVVKRWRESRAPAVIAEYRDGRGHPVVFDRRVFEDLARLEGDTGGRGVLAELGDAVERVPIANTSRPRDVDTEEDWQRMQWEWSTLT